MTRFLATLLASAALSTSLPLQARAELDVVSLKSAIERSVESDYPKLDALYKDIHAHPEIAFQEEKTAAKLAAEMRALGFEVTEHVGKTGLVAIYKNSDGPTIMVRTELDALPMEEKTGLAYASHDKTIWQGRETFVAHSCGHDIHMASWVGTAKTLVGLKDQWHGTLMFSTGRFLAMLPGSYLKFNGKRFGLKALPVKVPVPPQPAGVVTLKNRTPSPLAQLFIRCARDVAKPLAAPARRLRSS